MTVTSQNGTTLSVEASGGDQALFFANIHCPDNALDAEVVLLE